MMIVWSFPVVAIIQPGAEVCQVFLYKVLPGATRPIANGAKHTSYTILFNLAMSDRREELRRWTQK
jgi:hypothetical protein